MKSNTHIIGGVAAASLFKIWTHSDTDVSLIKMTYLGAAVLGSLLPDLCHPGSFVGKKTKILSKTISKTFGHRTITHSWVMILGLSWVFRWLQIPYEESIKTGLMVGVISHIALDAATSRGVQLLYPLHLRFRFPFYITTGSKIENHITTLLGFVAAVLMIHLYIFEIF